MPISRVLLFSLALLVIALPAQSYGAAANPLELLIMPGKVHAAHADFEGNCKACHSPIDRQPQQKLCTTCHTEVGGDMAAGTGFHGQYPGAQTAECQSCHTDHEGRDAELTKFPLKNFDHRMTDFVLQGAHTSLACESCHTADQAFSSAPTQCAGCHMNDDPHQGELGDDCASCHTDLAWTPTRFDHSGTGFPLTGQHLLQECTSCHTSPAFTDAQPACASCHTKDDVHQGSFGAGCQQCHGTQRWTSSYFDHAVTGFGLIGGHSGLACESCHEPGTSAKAAPTTCVGCHQADDVHQGRNGPECDSCHTVASWSNSFFDHEGVAGFQLLGRHASLACTDCHTGALTDPLPNTCAGCHTEDPHEGQLAAACADCHNNVSWVLNVRFDHTFSAFPLLGKHQPLLCADCHNNLRFHDAPSECSSCHGDEDVHAGVFGSSCGDCHSESGWPLASYDHEAGSGFALVGAHDALQCESCHRPGATLAGIAADDCQSCHGAEDPHGGRFGTDCESCHSADRFLPVSGY